ncbi:MAG: CARDB domain-containing protein [Planctomycetota bacterium]
MTETATKLAGALLALAVSASAQSYRVETFPRGMQELPDTAFVVWDGAQAPVDTADVELTLPFRFPGFGGHERATLHVDGTLSLGDQGRVDLFAADLAVRNQGRADQVRVGLVGQAPSRVWVVEFDSVSPQADPRGYVYGQVQLHEDGTVELCYGSTQSWNGLRAEIGLWAGGRRVGPGASGLPDANLRFVPSQEPDLALERVRVEGDRVLVTVANQGFAASAPGTLSLYRSRNDTISTQDPLLLRGTVAALAPGQRRELNLGLDLSGAADGAWLIGARLSGLGADADAQNDVGYDPRPVWVGAGSDLRVDAVRASSHEVLAGVALDVTVELEGQGAPSGAFDYAVFLSENDEITAGDRELARGRVAAGLRGRATEALRISLPADVAPGTYVLGVAVDLRGEVSEVDESNQTARDPLALRVNAAAPPDLRPTAVSLDVARAAVGDEVWITRTVENAGLAAAGAFKYAVLLSQDATPSADDARLLEGSVTSLVAGAVSGPRRVPAQVPALAAGSYRVLLVVDPEDRVGEDDEGNNVLLASAPFEVQSAGLPDLSAESVRVRYRTALVGGQLELSRAVANLGRGASGACEYALYLSTNDQITTSDRELHRFSFAAGLAAGERDSSSVTVDVPSSVAAGAYWVGLIVDPDDRVREADEGNNAAANAVFVRIDRGTTIVRPTPSRVYANDGDTIRVDGQTYRFIGADTPEKRSGTFDADQEPYASAASEFTRGKLRNAREVAIHHSANPDVYGRLLAHVFVDGESLSLLLVENAHAYQTVSVWGSNGFTELGREIRAAAQGTSLPFEEPRFWRQRHTVR